MSSLLSVKTLAQLSAALQNHDQDGSALASIRAMEISIETTEADEDEEDATAIEEFGTTLCSGVTHLLHTISSCSGPLDSFTWRAPSALEARFAARPASFWTALSKLDKHLKHLDLDFYTHELHALKDAGVNPLPRPFLALENLSLDLSGGHGDDASEIDGFLSRIRNLQSLELRLPGCDLESCRIKGLTYDWHFPKLRNLAIEVYVNDVSGLPAFLSRHPAVEILEYKVESQHPIPVSLSTLTNLRALYLGYQFRSENIDVVKDVTTITHLRVRRAEDADAFIDDERNVIRCLELASSSFWDDEDNDVTDAFKSLLPKLKAVQELGIEYQTGNTSWRDDDGTWIHPAPLSARHLTAVLALFPRASKLRAIRMTDNRAVPLAEDFMHELPECIRALRDLEFIKWGGDSDTSSRLYQISRTTSSEGVEVAQALEIDIADVHASTEGKITAGSAPLRRRRKDGERALWTDESVLDLDHLSISCF